MGVGMIAMLVFVYSVVCILALFTGDIRFQPNGYSPYTYRLPSVFGSFGIMFGFLGLLGVYDDRLLWVWAFNRFLLFNLAAMFIAMLFDRYELGKCDSWLDSEEYKHTLLTGKLGINYIEGNPPLTALAQAKVCPWARWAYSLGFAVDFGVWVYFAYKSLTFEKELRMWTAYPINFGADRDVQTKWRMYGVKDPRVDEKQAIRAHRLPKADEDSYATPMQSYGSMSTTEPGPSPVGPAAAVGRAPDM